MNTFLLWGLVIFVFLLIAPLLIGLYVYNDARKINLHEPVLWAIVAGAVPLCVGLMIYLIYTSDKRGNAL
ncbi:MAG: hypothetical protein WBL80_01575 [Erysipelotrichaceae bacterium]